MRDLSLRIGKIFGVPVELHWTFILLMAFALVYSASAFVLLLVLFFFVLLHEIVHCITSKNRNVRVKRIVLYPFGGGSILNFEDLKPRDEFVISLSGPIASIIFALVLWVPSLYITGSASQFLYLLALINLALGVFNILPWLPLDGGRALRSYLQEKSGFLKATRRAVVVSNVTTVAFIVLSSVYALQNASYSESYKLFFILFSIVVALFVYSGAQAELSYAKVKESIKGVKAKEAASSGYDLVTPDTKVSELKKRWHDARQKDTAHIVLFKKGDDIYMLSISAVQRAMRNPSVTNPSIGNFGVKVETINENAPLINAIYEMEEEGAGIMCVVKNRKVTGVLLPQRVNYVVGLHLSTGKTSK